MRYQRRCRTLAASASSLLHAFRAVSARAKHLERARARALRSLTTPRTHSTRAPPERRHAPPAFRLIAPYFASRGRHTEGYRQTASIKSAPLIGFSGARKGLDSCAQRNENSYLYGSQWGKIPPRLPPGSRRCGSVGDGSLGIPCQDALDGESWALAHPTLQKQLLARKALRECKLPTDIAREARQGRKAH